MQLCIINFDQPADVQEILVQKHALVCQKQQCAEVTKLHTVADTLNNREKTQQLEQLHFTNSLDICLLSLFHTHC